MKLTTRSRNYNHKPKHSGTVYTPHQKNIYCFLIKITFIFLLATKKSLTVATNVKNLILTFSSFTKNLQRIYIPYYILCHFDKYKLLIILSDFFL